tara:strand:+ start:2199 stop:3149 length:951 start_codon:yes stop_codon:yes gene_type:complete
MPRQLQVCNLEDWYAGGEKRKQFIQEIGDALKDIGFFALTGHGIDVKSIESAYKSAHDFFSLDQEVKDQYERPKMFRQRGYTPYGVEHAKDNPEPDLKEFWQTGRTLHPGHSQIDTFPKNFWPTEHVEMFEDHIDGLFQGLESISGELLKAAALYLQKEENWLKEMTIDGNTILRVIHYPPLSPSTPEGAVRSSQHEDINLITLLVGATADGLQVQDHDGSWIEVEGNHEHIIVDSGDMLQNLTNGLFKSTTHRVVNPPNAYSDRYSMPLFVHPRGEIDLTPQEEFIQQTGGEQKYPKISAEEYLHQRLVEIGLAS